MQPSAGGTTTSEKPLPIPQPQSSVALRTYRREEHLHLTPVEVIDKLYDVAILHCKKKNAPIAHRALNELIVALNFENNDLAVRLFGLYEYCKRSIRNGNYKEPASVLGELRSAWREGFHLK
jgi:flagellin-specific chaperone FliS